ncbi:MAG: hypothetical protein AAGD32_07865 [Planctomycetota bacterium]
MPRRSTVILFSALVLFIAGGTAFLYSWWTDELRPIRAVIGRGEQNWGDDATRMLERVESRSDNPNQLAERLVEESAGSLVVEGLLMMERHKHPKLERYLGRFADDERWTWYLDSVCDTVIQIQSRHCATSSNDQVEKQHQR